MTNEIQVIDQNIIVSAFQKQGAIHELFERVASEVRKEVPDVSTQKGRDQIGSLAMKVSKTKKLIEESGKALVADQKAQIKLIDDDRISVVKMFDALRDEVLAPRDAWKKADDDRIERHKDNIKAITDFCLPENIDVGSEVLASNIRYLEKVKMGACYEEFESQAKLAKFETLEVLRKALVERERYETEQAELERLRQAEIEKKQREHDEAIAKQAAENARIEAEKKAKAEIEKIEREKQAAIEREEKLKHEAEQAVLREKQAIESAKRAAEQAEHNKQLAIIAERERIEREQKAAAEHNAKLEQQRKANIEHMRQINNDVLSALVSLGLSEDSGKSVISAIAKNQVPHVSIKY